MTSLVADPAEAKAFLDANPQIQTFEVLFTNMSGVPRGKRLRRHEVMAVYEQGRFLPGSILVVDITGQDCEDTGLVWEDGDGDRAARPIPGRIAPAPWLGPDVAQIACSMFELDGSPNDLDPRFVLKRVIDRFEADGLVPVVACELEFYLLDAERDFEGLPRLPRAPITGERPSQHQVYGLREVEDIAPYLRDLWAAADAQNIPLEGAISEYAPSQVELTLKHKPDALAAADDAVLYKRIAKGVALKHGMEATFMAKPFIERTGSGFHLHVSVNDKEGRNLFAAEAPEGAPALGHAVAGMKALLAESMGIFAPNANSFRRFRANSYAPVAPTWGVNNRTVAFRVPAGPPPTRHIEHRVAGADANPYLAVAAMLAGVHHGLKNKLDPGPAVTGDGYAAAAKLGYKAPSNWFAAVDALEGSELLKDYLGARFVEKYCCVKRTEQERFYNVITDADYDWYLRTS